MDFELLKTKDGSATLYSAKYNSTFHSKHGALQESMHVFIENGLWKTSNRKSISILELGFGTGLNAYLSCLYHPHDIGIIHYHSLDRHRLPKEIINQLNVFIPEDERKLFEDMHTCDWNQSIYIEDDFLLNKIQLDFERFEFPSNNYDICYHDAFGPGSQEQFWRRPFLDKIYSSLKRNGYLTTYCAQGEFKRQLKSCGFAVENVPGPPGKREMTLAFKY